MSDLLIQYFESYAEAAIARMKEAVLAIGYYERIRTRLAKGEDLSSELAIIKTVGAEGTMQVVKQALVDYRQQIDSAWALNAKLQALGKFHCALVVHEREHLPRADVTYQFHSEAGAVRVHITSAGETFKLDISAGKNPMAAQLACVELERQLTFIGLSG